MGTDFVYITAHQSWAKLINTWSCYGFVPVSSVIRRKTHSPGGHLVSLRSRHWLKEWEDPSVWVCVWFSIEGSHCVVEGVVRVLEWIWTKRQLWQEVMERMARGAVCWYHTQHRCPSEWRKILTWVSGFRINRIKGFELKAHLISPTSLRCTFKLTSALGQRRPPAGCWEHAVHRLNIAFRKIFTFIWGLIMRVWILKQ